MKQETKDILKIILMISMLMIISLSFISYRNTQIDNGTFKVIDHNEADR